MVASGNFTGLMIVGLAPGLHGANKTGVPFTGDASGAMLFDCLNELQIAGQVSITNAVKCAPPENLPLPSERKNCRKFFREEVNVAVTASNRSVFFCLGRIAHEETLRAFNQPLKGFPFAHGAVHQIDEQVWIVDTYHCSRYNVNTGRITRPMFLTALQCAAELAQFDHARI